MPVHKVPTVHGSQHTTSAWSNTTFASLPQKNMQSPLQFYLFSNPLYYLPVVTVSYIKLQLTLLLFLFIPLYATHSHLQNFILLCTLL